MNRLVIFGTAVLFTLLVWAFPVQAQETGNTPTATPTPSLEASTGRIHGITSRFRNTFAPLMITG